MLEVVPKPVESVLIRTDVVAVGSFRCPVTHPLYSDSGPCSYHTFAFPRTATAIRHDDGTYFVATPNTISLYNQGQIYSRQPISDIDATDWYVVADDVLTDAIARYDESVVDRQRPFRTAMAECDPSVYLMQRRLFDQLSSGISTLAVDEAVMLILDRVLAAAFRSRPRESRRIVDAVEEAKLLIARDPVRSIALRTLARAAGCSPFHLCRGFRRITGETMTSFRRGIRLRIALEQLRSGRGDITTLALDLGFSTHSHFTAAFRHHFGFTPSQFRQAV